MKEKKELSDLRHIGIHKLYAIRFCRPCIGVAFTGASFLVFVRQGIEIKNQVIEITASYRQVSNALILLGLPLQYAF